MRTGRPAYIIVFLIFCIFTGDSLVHGGADPSNWHKKYIQEGYDVGRYSSIVIDASGCPHISYHNSFTVTGGLMYARVIGDEWHVMSVDNGLNMGQYTSIELDSEGEPHVSYLDGGREFLRYAYLEDNVWQTGTVDHDGAVGCYSSLALDSAGIPHIAYCGCETSDGEVRYAYWLPAEARWHTETVYTCAQQVKYTNIEMDSNDNACVCFWDTTCPSGGLFFAYRSGGEWDIEQIESGKDIGWHASMTLDEADVPHISYFDYTEEDINCLKYTWSDGWEWQTEIVEEIAGLEWYGGATSITLDDLTRPNIAYYEGVNCKLKFARYEEGRWRIEYADYEGNVGVEPSIALDGQGRPHISYYDKSEVALKYTYKRNKIWYDVQMEDRELRPGEMLHVYRHCGNPTREIVEAQEGICLGLGGDYWFWDQWGKEVYLEERILGAENAYSMNIFQFEWPEGAGTLPEGLDLFFAGALILDVTGEAVFDIEYWTYEE